MGYKVIDVLFPVMIHFLALQCGILLGGSEWDGTLRASFAAIVTLPFMWNAYRNDRAMWKKDKKNIAWYAIPLTMAGACILNQVLSSLIFMITAGFGFSNAAQEELLAGEFLMQIIGLGILVPFVEEILFRGLVYGKLERYLSPGTAVIVGAALFAIYHGNIIQMLFAFPMGITLNLLYRHYGGLLMPFLFHASSNLGAVLLEMQI